MNWTSRARKTSPRLRFNSCSGMVFFIGLRRHVYSKFPMPSDLTRLIAEQVDLFLGGARAVLKRGN